MPQSVHQALEARLSRLGSTARELAEGLEGFLYLNQPEGPVLVASRSNDPPPRDMEEHVLKCLRSPGSAGEDQTETTRASSNSRFAFLGISTHRGEGAVTAAIAMLDCSASRPRIVSDAVVGVLADALLDAGDVQPV